MTGFLLDSDVIIWFLRGKKETKGLLLEVQRQGVPGCSPISIVEVQMGVRDGERDKTNMFLDSLDVYAIDRATANKAGEYIREYGRRGIRLSPPDAMIAATCVLNDLVLVSYNSRHYPMPDVRLRSPDL
ncbi:MAG: type II toxin-antitoxin system VapC family toxin [Chloroflexi bacterium]|nr:type II toxin-antitoxin system VapC family toxin [Chloroflexota bacterium]